MATATLLTQGLDDLTKLALGASPAYAPKLRLFTNIPTITAASVLTDFTTCVLSGYSDGSITPASWTGSSTAGVATYTYPTITFTFSAYAGGTTIEGGVVFNFTDSKAIFAFLLDTPFAVPAGGGTLTVALTWTDKQCA